MKKYLLDTNICIYIIKKAPQKVINKFKKLQPAQLNISSISLSELQYGVTKSSFPAKNQIALAKFLAPIKILPFTDEAAMCYGEIRTHLEKKGKIIGAMDLLIAAHALAEDATLVTNNLREFARVPNIKLENWTT